MPQTDLLHLTLWIVGLVSLTVILVMLARRRLYREFPVFTVYIFTQLVGWAVMLWVVPHFPRYVSWFGWLIMQCLDVVLSMVVLLEVFSVMLKPYDAIRRVGAVFCALVGTVLLVIAIWMAITAPPSEVIYARITARVIAWQRSADFARLGLLFAWFVFTRIFGLNWRHYALGIAIGLGITAATEVLAESIRVQFGFNATHLMNLISPVGYNLGVLIWSYFFLRRESEVAMRQMLPSASLMRWNDALEELLTERRRVQPE